MLTYELRGQRQLTLPTRRPLAWQRSLPRSTETSAMSQKSEVRNQRSEVRSHASTPCSERNSSFNALTGFTLKQRGRSRGFTLVELVVTVGVLVLLVFLATQLLNSAATVTTLAHKQMDADAQTRQLLDRMALDFAQMVKRSDVDYYVKASWFVSGSPPAPLGVTGVRTLLQPGNDVIAFYSNVPGYYPTPSYQSPVSLVAYRVYKPSTTPSPCPNCNKLERMGKGLLWNAVTPSPAPVVFMPMPIASAVPAPELPPTPAPCGPTPTPTATASPTPAWSEIASTGSWSDSEVIGPQVFRFEYYYLLKGQM